MAVESQRVVEPLGSVASIVRWGWSQWQHNEQPQGLRQQPPGGWWSVERVKLDSTFVAHNAANRNKIYQVRRHGLYGLQIERRRPPVLSASVESAKRTYLATHIHTRPAVEPYCRIDIICMSWFYSPPKRFNNTIQLEHLEICAFTTNNIVTGGGCRFVICTDSMQYV